MLHAHNEERGKRALAKASGSACVLITDLSSIEETKALASKTNALGKFDVVIQNAGVYQVLTNSVGAEGLPVLFVVNSLAPYTLPVFATKIDCKKSIGHFQTS